MWCNLKPHVPYHYHTHNQHQQIWVPSIQVFLQLVGEVSVQWRTNRGDCPQTSRTHFQLSGPPAALIPQQPTCTMWQGIVKKCFLSLITKLQVFKMGEPTYSCRDCGLDPTCVLCVDCFKVNKDISPPGGQRVDVWPGFRTARTAPTGTRWAPP